MCSSIGKVNVGKMLKMIFTSGLKDRICEVEPEDLFNYMPGVIDDVCNTVRKKLKLLGSAGLA